MAEEENEYHFIVSETKETKPFSTGRHDKPIEDK